MDQQLPEVTENEIRQYKELFVDILDSNFPRKEAAKLLRIDKYNLDKYLNPNLTTHSPPIWLIVRLYKLTKDKRLIDLMAKNCGFLLIPEDDIRHEESLEIVKAVSGIMGDASHLVNTIVEAHEAGLGEHHSKNIEGIGRRVLSRVMSALFLIKNKCKRKSKRLEAVG